MKRDWTTETTELLRNAGWYAGRSQTKRAIEWQSELETPSGFRMSQRAREALEEFGGLCVESKGPGIYCARGGFNFNPSLAVGEEDRFSEAPELDVFPLGEIYDGHAFAGIGPSGRVYLIGDFVEVIAEDIYCAIEAILLGGWTPKAVTQQFGEPP